MAQDEPLPLTTRLWLAWVAFFRVLFDGVFAARVAAARLEGGAAPAAPEKPKPALEAKPAAPAAEGGEAEKGAMQLLAMLQREGRLVDFLEQDIVAFSDAEVGVAARVVHEGSRKTLRAHVKLEPVRTEEEGARVTVEEGFSPAEVKLTGDLHGSAPYQGVLRHRGWRGRDLKLPRLTGKHDATILAPAEVEL